MTELIQRLEHLAARLAATTEHHGYAHMVIEAVEAIKVKSLRSENALTAYRDARWLDRAFLILKAAKDACTYDSEQEATKGIYGLPPNVLMPMTALIVEIEAAPATNAAPQAVPTGSEATQIASSHRPMAEPAAAAPSETFQEWWNTAGFAQYPAVDGKTVAEAAWIECALKSAAQQDINYRDALDLLRRAWNEFVPWDTIKQIHRKVVELSGRVPSSAPLTGETPLTDEVEETMKRLRSQIPGCDCDNPAQCWEPCGTLGHSEKHIKVVKE